MEQRRGNRLLGIPLALEELGDLNRMLEIWPAVLPSRLAGVRLLGNEVRESE